MESVSGAATPLARFVNVFGNRVAVLPVIHAKDERQVRSQVELCVQAGAAGCWLINHNAHWRSLFSWGLAAKKDRPNFWIGLNCLDLNAYRAVVEVPQVFDGVWSDDGSVCDPFADDGTSLRQAEDVAREVAARRRKQPAFLYFGGVAFKGQARVRNLPATFSVARKLIDVPTTSGDATGKAPTVLKVSEAKRAVGCCPLALASGVTVENVLSFVPYVLAFLVATGVSRDFHHLDAGRLTRLIELVNGADFDRWGPAKDASEGECSALPGGSHAS